MQLKKVILKELLPFPTCLWNIPTPLCLGTDTRDTGLWGQKNPMKKSRWNLLGFPFLKKYKWPTPQEKKLKHFT